MPKKKKKKYKSQGFDLLMTARKGGQIKKNKEHGWDELNKEGKKRFKGTRTELNLVEQSAKVHTSKKDAQDSLLGPKERKRKKRRQ